MRRPPCVWVATDTESIFHLLGAYPSPKLASDDGSTSTPGVLFLRFNFLVMHLLLVDNGCVVRFLFVCETMLTAVCLFKRLLGTPVLSQPILCGPIITLSMTKSPSPCPVSNPNCLDDDGSHVQISLPPSTHDAQPPNPVVVDGGRSDCPPQPHEPSKPTYASTVKLGLGSHGSHIQSTLDPKSGTEHEFPEHPRVILKGDSSAPSSATLLSATSPLSSTPEESILEFSACCLIGKIWGETISLAAITHRTRSEWKFTRGQIDYVELGNEWILVRFANSNDRDLVFKQRPWYVSGLNFVLVPWVPFFDPFNTQITRVDQWLRIPRLPWEFWDATYLTDLLKSIGPVVRIDQNTLLRLKGKFARVCVNIDITKPLPGSITISRLAGCLRVPLIYEGLHEVCPLCGGESHVLQSCPNLPMSQKVEVLVEKFDATGVTKAQGGSSSNPISTSTETWVTVSPKKRVKTMLPPSLKDSPS